MLDVCVLLIATLVFFPSYALFITLVQPKHFVKEPANIWIMCGFLTTLRRLLFSVQNHFPFSLSLLFQDEILDARQ